jgi:hypothetical protein
MTNAAPVAAITPRIAHTSSMLEGKGLHAALKRLGNAPLGVLLKACTDRKTNSQVFEFSAFRGLVVLFFQRVTARNESVNRNGAGTWGFLSHSSAITEE